MSGEIGTAGTSALGSANADGVLRSQGGVGGVDRDDQQDGLREAAKKQAESIDELIKAFSRGSSAKNNCFSTVMLAKEDGFPPLYVTNPGTNVSTRIPPDEGSGWTSNLDAWLSAHGATGIIGLAKKLISLDKDARLLKPIFPDNPAIEDLETSVEGMREVLKMACKTPFGNHVLMPEEDEIERMNSKEIKTLFKNFSTVSSQLCYRLRIAAQPPGKPSGLMLDVFGPSNTATKKADGQQHPLAGLIILLQILARFQKDPQGTSVQMKVKLLADINARINDSKFTLYGTEAFLHEVDARITNILERDPDLMSCLEKEVNTAVCQVVRAACRRITQATTGDVALYDAAEIMAIDLAVVAKQVTSMPWITFQSSTLVMLTMFLPPEADQCVPCKKQDIREAMTLLTSHGYATPTKKTGGNTNKGRSTGKKAEKQPAASEQEQRYRGDINRWHCNLCGNPGHFPRDCTNPRNPKAAEIIEKVKRDRITERLEREKKEGQRGHMQRQGDRLAEESRTSKKAKLTGANDTEVRAGLARIAPQGTAEALYRDLNQGYDDDDDDHDYRGDRQGYPGPPTTVSYSHAYVAIVEEDTFGVMTASLVIGTSLFGILIAAMTPANQALQALSKLNIGAIAYVMLMFLMQMLIPDFQGSIRHAASHICGLIAIAITIMFFWTAYMGAFALGAFDRALSTPKRSVFVDSGCTHSVFCNPKYLANLRPPPHPYIVKGVGGDCRVTHIGDYQVALRDEKGQTHIKYVMGCLYAPDAMTNLLSTANLSDIGIGFQMIPHKPDGQLYMDIPNSGRLIFPLKAVGGLQQLPFFKDTMTCISGVSTHHLRALTEAELWHLRLGHASAHKIAKLSKHCKGISKPLAETDFPCHHCMDSNPRHVSALPKSEN